MIKYSTSGAEDYNKLAGAMEKIEMVVAVINERKRDDENMKKITDIQQLFDDPVRIRKKAKFQLTIYRKLCFHHQHVAM